MARARHPQFPFSPFVFSPFLHSLSLVLLCILGTRTVHAQGPSWKAIPFNTQSIPLHVKNPCNSIWAPQGSGPAQVSTAIPRLWDQSNDVKGWYASVRVDGVAYQIMGAQGTFPSMPSANQTVVIVTPTRSTYLLNAGPVIVNMTFLSPIEPADPVKMSSPFSYLYFTFASNDSSSHSVELYSDVTGEWLSGDVSSIMTWSGSSNGPVTILQENLVSPEPFQLNSETCQDGIVYYAMNTSQSTSWQIGPASTVRGNFANGTGLTNSASLPPLSIQDQTFTLLGIAVNVGSVQSTSSPVVYTVGMVRDPVIQYTNQEVRSPYYRSKYSSPSDLIADVLRNFSDSVTAAQKLDAQLAGAGGAISGNYADLLAISARQAFGAFDLTVPQPSSGSSVNTSDLKAFARNFGNLGSGGVNSPDVLYAAMPAYIYLWPDLLGLLLRPLLEYQETPAYTNPYAAQDIGGAYPNATGDAAAHNMQIEQSASMIIMALAHAQVTGDSSLISRHYKLLSNWADFLGNNTLAPISQETTSISDSISGANQTNLALKGIIGIGAMAKISKSMGQSDDENHYQTTATEYAQQWQNLAVTSNFISLTYGSGGSGVIYNLYADKLLQTNLIDESVFDVQTSYYSSQTQKNTNTYGVPLTDSSSSPISRTDWTMFAAASVTNSSVRDQLIGGIHSYASATLAGAGNFPFTVVYNPTSAVEMSDANNNGGIDSFAQGAMFAPLALSVPIKAVTVSSPGSDSGQGLGPNPKHKTNAGAIAGGVVGGLAALGAAAFIGMYFLRRRENSAQGSYNREDRIVPGKVEPGFDAVIEPFGETAEYRRGYTPTPLRAQNERSRDRLMASSVAGSSDRSYSYSNGSQTESLNPTTVTDSSIMTPSNRIRSNEQGASGGDGAIICYERGFEKRRPPPVAPSSGLTNVHDLSAPPRVPTPTEPLVREVAELRREIERMRVEHQARSGLDSTSELGADLPPPPSYDAREV